MIDGKPYRGRFAPTPSGPLHLGSLLTAVASYVQARSQGGAWLLRMDDLDHARNVAGADSQILRQLEAHALYWDGEPRVQSRHVDEYESAIERLHTQGLVYACNCTRRRLAALGIAGAEAIYDGHCRAHPPSTAAPVSLRLRTSGTLNFNDGWQGPQQVDLATAIGDFVVRRADGVVAYQLACAIDEAAQAITEVVRGADLLESTYRQLHMQQKLGLPPAAYKHLPVLLAADGRKLSKQNRAAAVEAASASRNLLRCLDLLGQHPPLDLARDQPKDILDWARRHWSEQAVPRIAAIQLE